MWRSVCYLFLCFPLFYKKLQPFDSKELQIVFWYLSVYCYFYCVNTSYPMDNCFTGRRDRSRQTTEKIILYKIPAGPVTECTFARCRLVHTSCLDRMTSSRLFSFGTGVYRRVFCCVEERLNFQRLSIYLTFYFIATTLLLFWSNMSSPGQRRGSCGQVMALFDLHTKCARCREKGIGGDDCS